MASGSWRPARRRRPRRLTRGSRRATRAPASASSSPAQSERDTRAGIARPAKAAATSRRSMSPASRTLHGRGRRRYLLSLRRRRQRGSSRCNQPRHRLSLDSACRPGWATRPSGARRFAGTRSGVRRVRPRHRSRHRFPSSSHARTRSTATTSSPRRPASSSSSTSAHIAPAASYGMTRRSSSSTASRTRSRRGRGCCSVSSCIRPSRGERRPKLAAPAARARGAVADHPRDIAAELGIVLAPADGAHVNVVSHGRARL